MLMADDVLFKLVVRSVAVGWQLWIALVVGVVGVEGVIVDG